MNDLQKKNISNGMKKSQKWKTLNQARKFERVTKICPICEIKFVVPIYRKQIFCSRNCFNKDTAFKFRKKAKGGIRIGSGRSKSGYYKGIYCGSTYELCWVIY